MSVPHDRNYDAIHRDNAMGGLRHKKSFPWSIDQIMDMRAISFSKGQIRLIEVNNDMLSSAEIVIVLYAKLGN